MTFLKEKISQDKIVSLWKKIQNDEWIIYDIY